MHASARPSPPRTRIGADDRRRRELAVARDLERVGAPHEAGRGDDDVQRRALLELGGAEEALEVLRLQVAADRQALGALERALDARERDLRALGSVADVHAAHA